MTDNPSWRKSTFSGSQADCLEAASADRRVLIRDTKQADQADKRTVLGFTAHAWAAFTAGLR